MICNAIMKWYGHGKQRIYWTSLGNQMANTCPCTVSDAISLLAGHRTVTLGDRTIQTLVSLSHYNGHHHHNTRMQETGSVNICHEAIGFV